MSGLTDEEREEISKAVWSELFGSSDEATEVYRVVARIADEREARTREAIATALEGARRERTEVCVCGHVSDYGNFVPVDRAIELARAGGASS